MQWSRRTPDSLATATSTHGTLPEVTLETDGLD
jgi:hypothetical protein